MGVRKAFARALGVVLLLCLGAGSALAAQTGYTLDDRAKRIPAPYGYVIDHVFDASGTAAQGFRGPLDMHIDKNGSIYVADTGNNRVLVFDKQERFVRQIPEVGSSLVLLSPEGLYVTDDGSIYVCDTGNSRILKFTNDGKLVKTFGTPRHSTLAENFRFNPTKLVVDERGYLYVVDANPGMILLDYNGNFRGMFAPNRMPFDFKKVLVRTFATKAQKERLAKETAPAHTNAAVDARGYVYSVTAYAQYAQIKKLNSIGINTYKARFFGEVDPRVWPPVLPTFADIAIDEYGVISVLDSSSGNIYQYDQEGRMLLVFGGKGEQRGQFTYPTSIAAGPKGMMYVLDSEKSMLQVFRPTEFANLVHQASKYYYDGQYREAGKLWKRIEIMNRSFALANRGMGQSYFSLANREIGQSPAKTQMFRDAMSEFRAAKERVPYSKAFEELRHDYARSHFGLVVFGLLAAIFAINLFFRGAKWVLSKGETYGGWLFQTPRMLLKVLVQPTEAFDEIKRNGIGQQAVLLVALFYCVRLASLSLTNYHFTTMEPDDVSLIGEFGRMVFPWFTWCIANYAITTIAEGEAFFKQVCIGNAFALSPYLLFSIPLALVSRFQTLTDGAAYTMLHQIVTWWTAFLLFQQVRLLNDYQFKKTVSVCMVSLVGVGVIWGMSALVYGLTDQLVKFVQEIVLELTIRG